MTTIEHLLAEIGSVDDEIAKAGDRGLFETETKVSTIISMRWEKISALAKASRAVDDAKSP